MKNGTQRIFFQGKDLVDLKQLGHLGRGAGDLLHMFLCLLRRWLLWKMVMKENKEKLGLGIDRMNKARAK